MSDNKRITTYDAAPLVAILNKQIDSSTLLSLECYGDGRIIAVRKQQDKHQQTIASEEVSLTDDIRAITWDNGYERDPDGGYAWHDFRDPFVRDIQARLRDGGAK